MSTPAGEDDLLFERKARQELERRLEAQIRLGRILAEPLAFVDAAPRLLEAIAAPFGWTFGAIWAFTTDFSALRCEAVWTDPADGYPRFVAETKRLLLLPGFGLPGRVLETDAPAVLADLFDETHFPRLSAARVDGLRDGLALPIRSEGRIVGVVELFAREAPAGYRLIEATEALSHQLAPFLERRRAERRLELVSEASRRLGESLDVDVLAKTAAELVAPELADWCAVSVVEATGLRRAAVMPIWAGPEAGDVLDRLAAEDEGIFAATSVLRSAEPLLVDADATGTSEPVRRRMSELGIASILSVPILSAGERLGVLVAASRPPRRIRPAKLPLFDELSGRLGAALQNARLFRRSEELIAEVDAERHRLDRLVENVPGVVWESWREPDPARHRVDFVSRHIEEMLGRPVAHFLSSRSYWLSAVHPEDRERAAAEAQEVFRTGRHASRFRWIGAQGEIIWVEAKTVLIRDRDGNPIGLRGVVFDITQQKEIEDALALRNDELARSNAELEQFAYAASHDLQEPLRTITSFAQVLERRHGKELPPAALDFLSQIADGAVRMQTLIRELLAFSRIGRGDERPVAVPLDAALDEALRNLDAAIAATSASIRREPLPEVLGRRRELVQLFQNLVGNAVKFRSDVSPEISITARQLPRSVEVAVSDNGIGIAKASHEKVFTLFRRLHDRADTPGTGIGLALCRKIVESHGGKIRFESDTGRGSTFFFTLPRE